MSWGAAAELGAWGAEMTGLWELLVLGSWEAEELELGS